jgi:argininosuccinate synthase
MGRVVTRVEDLLARPPEHLVLLFSGGLDSTYLLQQLSAGPAKVTALNVRIGEDGDTARAEWTAGRFGARYLEVDATDEFYAEFLPAAIHADAWYQGQFPVGSTLSRPLMARAAVTVAHDLGCDAVGHTATYMQNSAARLSRSIAALDPALDLVTPFLGTHVERAEKLLALAGAGVAVSTDVHSVDANPWSRVIENGSLETPENVLDDSVFTLTRAPADCPATPLSLTLGFQQGLPVSMNGTAVALGDLVPALNVTAGEHGVGRFSGLEDTPFGVKNHEIRESPAAAVITAAHRALTNAVHGPREHAVHSGLATEWTNTVVQGGWFSHLGRALSGCIRELDRPVTGEVQLRLHHGTITVQRLKTPHGLYYDRLGEDFHRWMADYAYEPWHHLLSLPDRANRGH